MFQVRSGCGTYVAPWVFRDADPAALHKDLRLVFALFVVVGVGAGEYFFFEWVEV